MDSETNNTMYKPRPMNPEDKSYRDVMMMFSDQPIQPKYWFEDFGDYWSCSCGQINREETCSNCGLSRELLKKIFVIQKNADIKTSEKTSKKTPDATEEVVDTAPVVEEDPEVVEARLYKRRKKRTKIILAILIFLILLLGGALAAFYFYYVPELTKQEEENASATTNSLMKELPAVMKPIAGANFNVYRNAGDKHYEKKEYVEAIEYYNKALAMEQDESVRQKILAAKYSYVANNQEQGGKTFKKYLDELKKANYPGVENIYERTYNWKASIVSNTGQGDYSTDMDSISRSYTVFFHTTLSGGPPNEKLNLYYTLQWPDGTSERQSISAAKGSGEHVSTRCEYTFPKTANEVKMVYKIYNSEDDSLLASDSVSLL